MSKEITSLCFVHKKQLNGKLTNIFYRIADLDTTTGLFSNNNLATLDVEYIINDSIDNNFSLGDIVCISWKDYKDHGITFTSSNLIQNFVPIELIFDDRICNKMLTDEEIREILRQGIHRSAFIYQTGSRRKLFLVLEKRECTYKVLCVDRKEMSKQQNSYYYSSDCRNMIGVQHTLNIYVIPKADVFTTSVVLKKSGNYKNVHKRYFYRWLSIPAQTVPSIFHLFTIQEYYQVYLKRYLTENKIKLNLTKQEISRIVKLVSLTQSSKKEFERFLQKTQYTELDITRAFSTMKKQILDDLQKEDMLFTLVNYTLRNDDRFREICVEEAQKQILVSKEKQDIVSRHKSEETAYKSWLAEKNQEQQKLNDEIKKQEQKLNETVQQINGLQAKKLDIQSEVDKAIDALSQVQSDVDETIHTRDELIKQKDKLEQDIQAELALFKDNLAHMAAVSFLSGTDDHNLEKNRSSVYIETPTLVQSEELTEITDADELLDCISDNLENICGLKKGFSFEIAKPMIAQICMHGSFIVYGNTARSIADCISVSVYGQRAACVTLPLNAADIPAVINEITAIDRTVICVENAFDSYNDYIALSLLRRNCGRIFVFGVNNKSSLNLLKDSNIWEYAIYLNVDHMAEGSSYAEVVPTLFTFPDTAINSDSKKSNFDRTYKELMLHIHAAPSLKRRLKLVYDNFVSSDLCDSQGEFYGVELLLSGMAKDELLDVSNEKFDAAFKELRTKAYNYLKEYREN